MRVSEDEISQNLLISWFLHYTTHSNLWFPLILVRDIFNFPKQAQGRSTKNPQGISAAQSNLRNFTTTAIAQSLKARYKMKALSGSVI